MGIPESQFVTWAKQGAIQQSRDTYATIKNALEANGAPYAGKSFTPFLQGSYGNDTNIYADSDVDMVMRLDSVFYHDLRNLPASDQSAFLSSKTDATYGISDFKKDVTAQLTSKFGADVKPGTKAIFIKGNGSRRDVDVLVCVELRKFTKFAGWSNQAYVEGICFFLQDGTRIDNFPKQHSENCTAKHQATNKWFKPTVRVLKNMRNHIIDSGLIKEGLAPSYYLEGLLYNVPNDKFGGSYADTLADSLNWILQADRNKFVCANEQFYLLREGSPMTWREANCTTFLNAAAGLWNNW
jgi:hypothetical protein